MFYGIVGIDKFQLVQKKNGSIIVKIESNIGVEPFELENVRMNIKKIMKSNDVCLNIVDKIPISVSGKHRFTISEI